MSKKRNALGRGLGALLEDTPTQASKKEFGEGTVSELTLKNIEVNPFQPRTSFDEEALQELADSIRTQGIIQPVTVRKLGEDKFQLISGERRYQASKLAGLDAIPAYVRTANDQQMLEMALIENIQRENLNALEISLSYQRLITECNLKQEELGDRVGKKRATVNNYLRLLKLPPDIQAALRDGNISMGHARALVNIENVEAQLAILKKIISEDLSVRKTEALARQAMATPVKKAVEAPKDEQFGREIVNLQNQLGSHFGTKVSIKSDGKKGEIKIPFVSVEDLNRILEILDL